MAIGTLLSKLISFFLLPLYTAYLATEDFGRVDVLQTIASLLLPLISLELTSATFRFLIDNKDLDSKKEIISTTTVIQITNSLLFILFAYLIRIEYFHLFILYFITMMFVSHIQYIVRGFGKTKLFSIMSFISTFVSLVLNVLLIAVLKKDANSILIAHIVANIVTFLFASTSISFWKYIELKKFSKKKLLELLKYSFPLIPNAVSWWIANVSDRLIIRFFIGSSANGIYAIANKLPVIYTTIFNVYNMAWVESVSKEIGNANSNEFINTVFQKSIRLFGCICLGIICVVSITYSFLLGKNYSSAYNHIFILMIAIFFNSLCSIIGSILTGLKQSKIIGITTSIGAIANILINISFVKIFGLYAASISTLISYILIFIIRQKSLSNYIRIIYPNKYVLSLAFSLLITTLSYFVKNLYLSLIVLIYLVIWTIISNRDLLVDLSGFLLKKIKKTI